MALGSACHGFVRIPNVSVITMPHALTRNGHEMVAVQDILIRPHFFSGKVAGTFCFRLLPTFMTSRRTARPRDRIGRPYPPCPRGLLPCAAPCSEEPARLRGRGLFLFDVSMSWQEGQLDEISQSR